MLTCDASPLHCRSIEKDINETSDNRQQTGNVVFDLAGLHDKETLQVFRVSSLANASRRQERRFESHVRRQPLLRSYF